MTMDSVLTVLILVRFVGMVMYMIGKYNKGQEYARALHSAMKALITKLRRHVLSMCLRQWRSRSAIQATLMLHGIMMKKHASDGWMNIVWRMSVKMERSCLSCLVPAFAGADSV
jgi:hypothetical protein